jgi:hypothetical protein
MRPPRHSGIAPPVPWWPDLTAVLERVEHVVPDRVGSPVQ